MGHTPQLDDDYNPPGQADSGGLPRAAKKNRARWFGLFTVCLAIVLLYLALRDVNWKEFLAILSQGRYILFPVVFAWSSLNQYNRAFRWRLLLKAEKPLPSQTVFWANMVGNLANAFLPARAGELIRSVALGYSAQISSSFVLATALTERLMDVVVLVMLGSVALLSLPGLLPGLAQALQGMAVLGMVGVLVLLATPHMQWLLQKLLDAVPLPGEWRARLQQLMVRFLDGMRSLHDPRRAALFIAMTLGIWLMDGVGLMIGAVMLNLHLTLPQALLLLVGLGLSSALPSTPGYVGVFQFVAVFILTPFGFSASEAVAFILVMQAINYLMVTVWGVVGIWRLNLWGWLQAR